LYNHSSLRILFGILTPFSTPSIKVKLNSLVVNTLSSILFFLFCSITVTLTQATRIIKVEETLQKSSDRLFSISEQEIFKLSSTVDESIIIHFEIADDINWKMILKKNRLNSDSLNLLIHQTDGEPAIIKQVNLQSYQGHLIGDNSIQTSLNLINDKLYLSVFDIRKTEEWHLNWDEEKLDYILKNKRFNFIEKSACQNANSTEMAIEYGFKKSNVCQSISLDVYTDFAFYEKHGNNIEQCLNNVLTTTQLLQQDYTNEFDIDFVLTEIHLVTCRLCDPYSNSSSVTQLLNEFNTTSKKTIGNQIKILLTGRLLDNLYVGLANLSSICSDKAKAVVQSIDFSAWAQRVSISHEVGHILGATHDNNSGINIMSSSISNTNYWSPTSVNMILSKLNNVACLKACAVVQCPEITDIDIVFPSINEANINWSAETGTTTKYYLYHRQDIISSGAVNNNTLLFKELESCQEYELILEVTCSDQTTKSISTFLETKLHTSIEIETIKISRCDVNNFDLKLDISHNLNSPAQIQINVLDYSINKIMSPTDDHIILKDLAYYNQSDISIYLSILNQDVYICADEKQYDMPQSDCSMHWIENFNESKIPDFWKVASNNGAFFTRPYAWKCDGTDREISNYGWSSNPVSGRTIDGSKMAYIDDDYISSSDYTGTTELISPAYNLGLYDRVEVSFDYLFHKFNSKGENSSHFSFEIWNGASWVLVFNSEETACDWFKIWDDACTSNVTLNITEYIYGEDTKFKFVYTDGDDNQWTGMVAIDNVSIKSYADIYGCLDESALNYNQNADTHLQNSCMYQCATEYMLVNDYSESIVKDVNIIESSGHMLSKDQIELKAQQSVTLSKGFSLDKGASLLIEPKQCSPE